MKQLTERLRDGERALASCAAQAERLENELADERARANSAEQREEELRRELDEIEDAAPLIEDLEDMRRGVLEPADLYERYLTTVYA